MIKREKSHSTPHTEGPHTPDVKHIRNPDVLHEVSDVNTGPIYKFGVWMIVIIVGTGILMWLMYDLLAAHEAESDPPKPVMEQTASKIPPEPRLQLAPGHEVHPLNEMAELKAEQHSYLKGYGWVDKGTGSVRIPIGEAKKLLLAKGLPVGKTMTMAADSAARLNSSATGENEDWKYGRAVPSGQSGARTTEWHR